MAVLLVLALLVVGGCGDSADDTGTDGAPALADPDATGRELTSEYMSILQDGDTQALEEFELGPEVLAEQDVDVLVVRWAVRATEASDKGAMGEEEAPRLSTFAWRDGGWKLVAHANFNTAAR